MAYTVLAEYAGKETGAFSKGAETSGGNISGGSVRSVWNFNAKRTLNPADGKTIDNPAYKDPVNGKPVEVKTKNFTYKNWIRKF